MSRKIELIISFFVNVFTLGFVGCVLTRSHHEMVESDDRVKFLKYASFKDFKREFDKRTWVQISHYDSLCSPDLSDCESYLHAYIYRFGDVGYLMTTYGFLRVESLIKKHIRKLRETNRKPFIK